MASATMAPKLLLPIALLLLASLAMSASVDRRGDWLSIGQPDKSSIIPLSVALTIRNREWLSRTLEDVSNPKSPNWRKFKTKNEVREMTAPTSESVAAVLEVLQAHNVVSATLSGAGDLLSVEMSIYDVERLFHVDMLMYQHIHKPELVIVRATSEYRMPASLAGLVDTIGMLSEFPASHYRTHSSHEKLFREQALDKELRGEGVREAADSGTCNSVMNYGYPEASDTDVYSQVQIVCCNGELTQDAQTPCSDFPPALVGFDVEVWNNFTRKEEGSGFRGIPELECFSDGTGVSCNVPFNDGPVESYVYHNLRVSGVFQNVTGEAAIFPTALITSAFISPKFFYEYYDIPWGYRGRGNVGNSQSVAEFSFQFYSSVDLNNFFGNMSMPSYPVIVEGFNGEDLPGDEATLDIEWMMAVGANIDTYFWSVKPPAYLLEWTNEIYNADVTPLVNSISYGANEGDAPLAWRTRCDQEFQKLGVIGASVMVSSGDAGATNIGHGSESCDPLQPQYPASSDQVTSVSATFFSPNDDPICSADYFSKRVHCSDLGLGEVAVGADHGMDWTTGGGFSNSIPRPSWQDTAVQTYLDNYADLLPPSNMFNDTNRGYPDVSATGNNLFLILDGGMDLGGGTSASCPIFAAIIGLINDVLLDMGEAPLGFVNPLLYQIAADFPHAFYDVTVGDNKCGDVLHPPYVACCEYGYSCSVGWDPVTGLGTPRFAALRDAVLSYVQNE